MVLNLYQNPDKDKYYSLDVYVSDVFLLVPKNLSIDKIKQYVLQKLNKMIDEKEIVVHGFYIYETHEEYDL
jgi:hypothetical protein